MPKIASAREKAERADLRILTVRFFKGRKRKNEEVAIKIVNREERVDKSERGRSDDDAEGERSEVDGRESQPRSRRRRKGGRKNSR